MAVGATPCRDFILDWVQRIDDSLAKTFKYYWDPLSYDTNTAESGPADENHAWWSANRLDSWKTNLDTMLNKMNTAETDRLTYWTGPASKAFGDIFVAYRNYVQETSTTAAKWADVTRNKVYQGHHTAKVEHGGTKAHYQEEWSKLHKAHVPTLLEIADWLDIDISHQNPQDSWDPLPADAETRKRWEDNYNSKIGDFDVAARTMIGNANAEFTTSQQKARTAFYEAYLSLDEFSKGPRFSSVKITDPDAKDPDKKKDPNDMPDRDGDGTPDYIDMYPDDPTKQGPQPPDPPDKPDTPTPPDTPSPDTPSGDPPGGDMPKGGGDPTGGAPNPDDLAGGKDLPGGDPTSPPVSPVIPPVGPIGPTRGGQVVTGPDGTTGIDVTGNKKPDLGLDNKRLPSGDLPPGARVVQRENGGLGIDLDRDGIPDVGMDGRALPEGSAPPGSTLVTGPDGTTGYDITGNATPDLDVNGQPLPNGDLPAGSRVVIDVDGTKGIDLDGDGLADVTFDGRAIPGRGSPVGGRLATGADGVTGFDLNGDGLPEVGLDGKQLAAGDRTTDPRGVVPGDQIRRPGSAPAPDPSLTSPATPSGSMMPPMMPPMGGMGGGMGGGGGGGGGNKEGERERETWLLEDDDVWVGADTTVAVLGRPPDDDYDEEEEIDVWEAPPRKRAPGGPRQGRPPAGWAPGSTRR